MQSSDVNKSPLIKVQPESILLNELNTTTKTIQLSQSPYLESTFTSNIRTRRSTNNSSKSLEHKDDVRNEDLRLSHGPEDSTKAESTNEVHLLPSKTCGNSEIILSPMKEKKQKCGHCEPCENVVCDVIIEKYIDNNEVFPLLATNIKESEIDAPVSKHCENHNCDSLSIDHNQCRRAMVKLYRCDISNFCDVCDKKLKTRKFRIRHRNCIRRNEYRHNKADAVQMLKERMRERELQFLEASESKKVCLDSTLENNRAMELLKSNKELIIIPTNQVNQQLNNTSIVLTNETNYSKQNSQNILKLSQPLNNNLVTTAQIPIVGKQYSGTVPTTFESFLFNDWMWPHLKIVSTSTVQPKQFLTPVHIIPLTNLITQPSLLHQTQDVQKFCIVANNSASTSVASNTQTVSPLLSNNNSTVSVEEYSEDITLDELKRDMKRLQNAEGRLKRKNFKCCFCCKYFSTSWYFKTHIAKHIGDKTFSCNYCRELFVNRYAMKKHIISKHKNKKSSYVNSETVSSTSDNLKCDENKDNEQMLQQLVIKK